MLKLENKRNLFKEKQSIKRAWPRLWNNGLSVKIDFKIRQGPISNFLKSTELKILKWHSYIGVTMIMKLIPTYYPSKEQLHLLKVLPTAKYPSPTCGEPCSYSVNVFN